MSVKETNREMQLSQTSSKLRYTSNLANKLHLSRLVILNTNSGKDPTSRDSFFMSMVFHDIVA